MSSFSRTPHMHAEAPSETIDPTRAPDDLRMRYFRTIDRKTATLFGFACEAGAALAPGAR